LNSGRLKVGADRYREITAPEMPNAEIRIAMVGPVGAGKSSLITILSTETIVDAGAAKLSFFDTPGYGPGGANDRELAAAADAAANADLILLMTPARHAARAADAAFLQGLRDRLLALPQRRLPPVLGVLTHADALTPAAEWHPPYDWQHGDGAKETHMRDAVQAAAEVLDARGILPVCTAPERIWNIGEGLIPAIADCLGDARGAAILRMLNAERSPGARKVLSQLANAGGQALNAFLRQ
jgi:uncharacterized protein